MCNSVSYQKELPSLGHYDVVVFGGGPAGVCSALAAARSGAKVLLAESTGMLGGMATTALVGPFMTCYDRKTRFSPWRGITSATVPRQTISA